MPQKSKITPSITFHPAQPAEAKLAGRLIFDSFPKMATFLFGLGDSIRAKKVLAKLFTQPGNRFSYAHSTLIIFNQRPIGIFIAYPGKKQFSLNWRLGKQLMKQYNLKGKIQLIRRSLPAAFIQEAAKDEFLLSNLAIKKRQRGLGFGSLVMASIEENARKAGCQKISLLVAIDNPDVRRFYERHGFKIKALHLEPNYRVRYLGPGYQRMVKELN